MTEQSQPIEMTATTEQVSDEAENTPMEEVASNQEMQSKSSEERHHHISERAYYIAEGRGFQGDTPLDDWLQAEAEFESKH